MAEKYYGVNAYSYCAGNPVNLLDIAGRSIFKIDKKTGDISFYRLDDNEYDTLIEIKKNGKQKIVIDNIEKGILHNHINFQENDHIYILNKDNTPSLEGIEAFVLELSNYVGKEIGGAYFSEDGSLPVTEVTLGRYRYNSYNSTQNHGLAIWANYHNRHPKSGLAGIFHTHPYYDGRDKPSRKDLNVRNNYLKEVPTMVFYIITYPVYYGDQTPYKFPYTYWAY